MVRKRRINEDRISALPEALILHILSFLPRGDQIKTGALSRSWQFLWTHSPDLSFDCVDYQKRTYQSHDVSVNWLNRALILCNCPKVNYFRVRICYRTKYEPDVHVWTEFAANRHVERFELDFTPDSCLYTLPKRLYRNSSFTELRFVGCNFQCALLGTVSWKSLKKLTVSGGELTNEALQKILAGAPALEILELFIVNLPPTLPPRGRFSYFDFPLIFPRPSLLPKTEPPRDLEFSAPNVKSLEVKGEFRSCKLVNMTSLVRATVLGSLKDPAEEVTINSLLHVQTLTIGTSIIKGIAKLQANGVYLLFSKCKCLTIDMDTDILRTKPSAIGRLLKSTGGIERLTVTMSYKIKDEPLRHSLLQDGYWTSRKGASRHLRHLRIVKFVGFWAYRNLGFSFVQFLLKNAGALEKMIINLEREGYPKRVVPDEVLETSQKLLGFERSSPNAQFLVH